MDDKLNIPDNIRVGYQERSGTYTGKLAYVVFYDNKGVLRKEKSWEGWRDKKIDPQDFKNEPTSGFVLNKDAGGKRHSWSSWNTRMEKVRVYDPRDFEFEISIPNLLFILQECTSVKGKGLEGEFVYAWQGTELILLPVSCQEYKASSEFTQLQKEKITAKDVIIGHSYINKDKREVMYMGKFTWYERKSNRVKSKPDQYGRTRSCYDYVINGSKQHVFVYLDKVDLDKYKHSGYWLQTGFTGLARKTSDNPLPQYADVYEILSNSTFISKPSKLIFEKGVNDKTLERCYGSNVCINVGDRYFLGYIDSDKYQAERENRPIRYRIVCRTEATLIDGEYREHDNYMYNYSLYNDSNTTLYEKSNLLIEEVEEVVGKLVIEHENGARDNKGE